jgi:copper(I)-binding protein
MPDGVNVLETPDKPGWKLNVERKANRVTAVTWQGRLEAKAADQFGLFMTLPDKTGPIYFPAVQRCAMGENQWTQIPAQGQAWRDVPRPAPVLQLTAAATAEPPSMVMAGNIMIMDPWSRATPPGATTGAAYLTLMNHGTEADTLTGGSSPAAEQVQIHQMSNAGGVMSMRPVQGVPLPRNATVLVTPQGGYHVMLVGLKAPLKQGTPVTVTLTFAKAGAVQVQFPVLPIGSQGPNAGTGTNAGAMPGMDHDHH